MTTLTTRTQQLLTGIVSAIAFGAVVGLLAGVILFAKYGEPAYAVSLLVGGVCSVLWWLAVRGMIRGAPA